MPFVGSYVRKPKLSREGANVQVVEHGKIIAETSGEYGEEGHVYQEYFKLPDMEGNTAVIGSWLIGGEAAGMGIRESTGLITSNTSRFVPQLLFLESVLSFLHRLKSYLKLHFIVLIWGFTAILGKEISIPAVELVFYRTLLAMALLAVVLVWRKQPLQIGWAAMFQVLGIGCLIAAHWILFFAAARVANVSACLIGMATSSLWTGFLEPLANRRKISKLEIGFGLLAPCRTKPYFYP